jgi:hypothetical protein
MKGLWMVLSQLPMLLPSHQFPGQAHPTNSRLKRNSRLMHAAEWELLERSTASNQCNEMWARFVLSKKNSPQQLVFLVDNLYTNPKY